MREVNPAMLVAHAALHSVYGFDTHGPIGPYLVTRDEAGDGPFDIRTWVNDELKQHSSTSQLIFCVSASTSQPHSRSNRAT
jgi:2-keto-4-pentenoate hydratase/2-oxohepta-3-ene-1,7-dioic acid hydratase in catechol pathway